MIPYFHNENQTYRFVSRKTSRKRYVQMRACALYFTKYNQRRKGIIMKKLLSVLLSAVLCLSMLAAFPCFADRQPDVPTPYVDNGGGDNF